MDRLGLWAIPYVVVLIFAGEVSRVLLCPVLASIQPAWPAWLITFVAPLPGLLLVGGIGFWLYRHLKPPPF